MVHGPWLLVRFSSFESQSHRAPLPGSRSESRETRLYDPGARNTTLEPRILFPGLLGQIAGCGSIWVEGWGLGLTGACGSVLGRVVDEQRRSGIFHLFTTSGLVSDFGVRTFQLFV